MERGNKEGKKEKGKKKTTAKRSSQIQNKRLDTEQPKV